MTYEEFINNILSTRGRFLKDKLVYKERHHILSKCLGGADDESNLIDLLAEEHYTAHKLLALENPEIRSLVNAWNMMAFPKGRTKRDFPISAEDYAVVRKMWSKHMHDDNPFLDENGHPHNYGKPMSEEQKQHLSDVKKGVKLGPNSEETKCKKSNAAKLRYKLHPETFTCHNRGKRCITNGDTIQYIDNDSALPEGFYYGNCKTSGTHNMHNYWSDAKAQKRNSLSKSGARNSSYGHGERVSGGKNGKAIYDYWFEGQYFECRKYLVEYLNSVGYNISCNNIRAIQFGTCSKKLTEKYKYIMDNLQWSLKDENKVNN